MKRVFLSFAFLLSLSAALFSFTNSKPLATTYWQADASNKEATCTTINCGEILTQPLCNIQNPGFTLYKSLTGQPACQNVANLRRNP